jgi:hypothetical protein
MREGSDAFGEQTRSDALQVVEARDARLSEARLFVQGDLGRDVSDGARDRSNHDGA